MDDRSSVPPSSSPPPPATETAAPPSEASAASKQGPRRFKPALKKSSRRRKDASKAGGSEVSPSADAEDKHASQTAAVPASKKTVQFKPQKKEPRRKQVEPPKQVTPEVEQSIRDHVDAKRRAFQIQCHLLETVDKAFLERVIPYIAANHYEDVVAERNMNMQCGYPACDRPLLTDTRHPHNPLLIEKGLIHDDTELRQYCSSKCMAESKLVAARLAQAFGPVLPPPELLELLSLESPFNDLIEAKREQGATSRRPQDGKRDQGAPKRSPAASLAHKKTDDAKPAFKEGQIFTNEIHEKTDLPLPSLEFSDRADLVEGYAVGFRSGTASHRPQAAPATSARGAQRGDVSWPASAEAQGNAAAVSSRPNTQQRAPDSQTRIEGVTQRKWSSTGGVLIELSPYNVLVSTLLRWHTSCSTAFLNGESLADLETDMPPRAKPHVQKEQLALSHIQQQTRLLCPELNLTFEEPLVARTVKDLVSTFSFHEPVPSLSTAQWIAVTLVLIELAGKREAKVAQQLHADSDQRVLNVMRTVGLQPEEFASLLLIFDVKWPPEGRSLS